MRYSRLLGRIQGETSLQLCQFNGGRLGVVDGEIVRDVTPVLAEPGLHSYPLPTWDLLIAELPAMLPKIEKACGSAEELLLSSVSLGAPVANPGKLITAPVNYQKHLQEAIGEPETFAASHVRQIHETGLFLKATSSLVGSSVGSISGFPTDATIMRSSLPLSSESAQQISLQPRPSTLSRAMPLAWI